MTKLTVRIPRTYRLDPDVIARVNELATAYEVGASEVVNVIMHAGLVRIDAGYLRLVKEVKTWQLGSNSE